MFESKNFKDFGGGHRLNYPKGFYRVTAGYGGESILFTLGDKVFLYDCGMAFCYKGLLHNIELALAEAGKKTIDYILISHTHYDHIGALPYVLELFPNAICCGAAKCKEVFSSKTAVQTMLDLGNVAKEQNGADDDISNTSFRIDKILADGDTIELKTGEKVKAIETKGHTDCSLSFYVEPIGFLFASESTGVLIDEKTITTAILKDYNQTIEAAEKLKGINANYIYSPHYGMIPPEMLTEYFDLYIKTAGEVRNFILTNRKEGLSNDEILEKYVDNFYDESFNEDHPKAAFMLNAKYIIKNMK